MLDFLNDWSWFNRVLIVGSFIVGFVVLILLATVLIKPKIKAQNFKYFYAFSAGFMIIVAALGLFHEARERVNDHFHEEIEGWNIGLAILLFVGSFLLACLIIYGIKQMVNPTKNSSTIKHKWVAIILILSHRVPASIVIGLLAVSPQGEFALLLVIALHLIPEVLILYYRQIDMGYAVKTAIKNSLLVKLAFFVLIILGGLIAKAVNDLWWLETILFIIAGTTMTYGVITELIPEFIGFINPHHHSPSNRVEYQGKIQLKSIEHHHEIVLVDKKLRKSMLQISVWLLVGILTAITILLFHM